MVLQIVQLELNRFLDWKSMLVIVTIRNGLQYPCFDLLNLRFELVAVRTALIPHQLIILNDELFFEFGQKLPKMQRTQ